MPRLLLALIGAVLGAVLGARVHPVLGAVLALVGFYIGGRLAPRTAQQPPRTTAARAQYTAEEGSAAPPGAYRGVYKDLEIVGESYRQPAIKKLWRQGGAERTFEAELVPENDNPHDQNAVRVEIEGTHVAYLSRESAKEYRGYMSTARCRIPVHLVQGGSEGTVGVFTGRSAADNEALRRKRTA